MPSNQGYSNACIGVGLRHAHYEQALSQPSPLDFVEVHTENFFAAGGASLAVLKRASELYTLSLHCTALGPGSARPVPELNLKRVSDLVSRFDPLLVSDHLCFTWSSLGAQPVHLGELLPVQRTEASLDLVSDNVDRIQEAIDRRMLIENISSYVEHSAEEMPETEYLSELVARTDCGLLLDINNLVVNAHNAGADSPEAEVIAWIDALPQGAVGEIHLAGFTPVASDEIAVDDHSQPVSELTWRCYAHAVRRFGAVPTLIEWDNALPEWAVLLEQAARARAVCERSTGEAIR
ncbi:MAG: DUF692 domain-containing protein [Halieaceae bacterium]|jgi:uncharacterized protein (UPF0276 family)|nr:DUF692 domain-containing protein [Halieaceae bacterium]